MSKLQYLHFAKLRHTEGFTNVNALGCGAAQLEVRRLAVRQARVRISARHPMEVLLLLSEEAMRLQEDGPRRMVKDERSVIVLYE